MYELNEKELAACKKIYEYIGTEEQLESDLAGGYMTINKGRDGKQYVWLLTEFLNVICDVEENIIIDGNDNEENDQKIEDLFC